MASLPYMQFYVADYLADTIHLTAEEHGAYLLLLFNYWQTGKPLPKSRLQAITRLSNERWTVVEQALNEYFNDDGETWSQKRIQEDLERVNKVQNQRSSAGKASAKARKNKASERVLNERSNGRSTNTDTYTYTDTYTEGEREEPPPPENYVSNVPEDWQPDDILPTQVRITKGVDIEKQLLNFRAHTFNRPIPRHAIQGKWIQWLNNARPEKTEKREYGIDPSWAET